MGSHSSEKKKEKRRKQKKRKRATVKRYKNAFITDESSTTSDSTQELSSSISDCSQDLSNTTSDYSQDVQHQHEGDFDSTPVNSSPLQQCGGQDTDSIKYVDEDFFAALDRISDDNMKYWDMCVQKEIEELEQYHDGHPAFVTDEKRAVVVQVTNSAHRGSSGLLRVSMEEYFKRIHKREEKALELCKLMRDRIEELETSLLDSKARIMKMHRQNQRKIEKVRYFWRNKIYEGSCRSGRMLMAAMDPDTYT